MSTYIETPRIITHNAVELATGTDDTSDWFPCDSVAEHKVWITQVLSTPTGGDLDVFIDYSPYHYQVLRDLGTSVTTQYYERITVSSADSSEILHQVTISDVADLEYTPASFRTYIDNDSAKTTTVTVIVEGKG